MASSRPKQEALKIAKKIGFPVMIKAVAGGGGRGMRPAHNEASLLPRFHAARTEAEKAFGNGDVYIEKLIVNPHHIEFQIMADSHGRRGASRRARLLDPAAEPEGHRGMSRRRCSREALRKKMGKAAVKLAESVGYVDAGTMEFLVDNEGNYYFMEMNTRIQVEHTITEEVYGCDLVKEQIKIAAGEHLSPHVASATPRSHAIQCRINAEDPEKNFQPSPGRIDFYYAPGGRGVRIDSHAYTGYIVPPYYDSMIAKLIAVGAPPANRASIGCAARWTSITSPASRRPIPFHSAIMRNAEFRAGKYDTGFVERVMSADGFELKHTSTRLHE